LFLFAIPQEKLCFSFDLQGFLLLAAASGDSLVAPLWIALSKSESVVKK